MIKENNYPILEFDEDKNALIEPSRIIKKKDVPEECIIAFFGDIIDKKKEKGELKQVSSICFESIIIPVYITKYEDKEVGIVLGFLGSAGCAGELEELIAIGFKKFIVCGGAGVLKENINVGQLFVVESALRDEGVSYHYIEVAREIKADESVVNNIKATLDKENIPSQKIKTWTTDAVYRETRKLVELREKEGCTTVEMESAALLAVAKYRNVKLGQILYAGDNLSGEEWDERGWKHRGDIRENLVELSIKCCINI